MTKFQRPPLTIKEKERAAETFIDGAARLSPSEAPEKTKEKKGVIFLRVQQSVIDDLKRIEKLTGYKSNIFCLHVIIEAIRDKLKQIEREL